MNQWEPLDSASATWYNHENLKSVRAALVAALQKVDEELRVFLEDEDREEAASGPAAALVAIHTADRTQKSGNAPTPKHSWANIYIVANHTAEMACFYQFLDNRSCSSLVDFA